MMKLVALAVVSALGVAVAGTGSAITGPKVIRVVSIGALDVNLDSEREPKAGDRFVFAGALHSWLGTKPDKSVGHEEVLCTFTAVHFERGWARVSCAAQFSLPGGTVSAESSLRFTDGPQKFIVPVTGGTGVYFNASGSIVIRDIGKSGNNALTFNMKP